MLTACPASIHLPGKFLVLANLLDVLRRLTQDRIVIVSNYTQTLDLIALVRLAGWVCAHITDFYHNFI